MNRSLFLCLAILFAQSTQARDAGYALECAADTSTPKLIVSFLETDVDKRVRYVESAAGAMWDEHEWLADRIFVRSFRQVKDAAAPTLVSSLEIERESLQALETEAIREFYAAIEACCSSLRSAALNRMERATASSELPQRLNEEGYFYLGGLALEVRMPGIAEEILLQSRDTNDTSPRKSLRDLYLRQLLLISK